jgi:signal transduction histidine kinase
MKSTVVKEPELLIFYEQTVKATPDAVSKYYELGTALLSEPELKDEKTAIQLTQLKEENESLKQELEMNQLMLSIIAHDVRNPLGAIKGVMDFMTKHTISDEDRKRLTEKSSEQLDTTIDLLNNLVDWGKSNLYKDSNNNEHYQLKSLVQDIISHFELNLLLKNNMVINLVDGQLLLFQDMNMMGFILRNLITNAIKFTRNGTITVSAYLAEGKVHISVTDTGIGMTGSQLETMFQKQKHQSTNGTNNEKGSGMGLMLTRNFVDALNGSIHIQSEPGKGTTVHLKFAEY